jgi:nitroreductase / dihydropteridine reductase
MTDTFMTDQLKWRAAVKKYDPTKKLTKKQLDTLLEAANLSPSAYGLQPYKLYVASSDKVKAAMAEVGYHQPQFTTASHVIVLASAQTVTHEDVDAFAENIAQTRGIMIEDVADYAASMHNFIDGKDDASLEAWAARQVYIPLGVLVSTAASMNIDSSPMEGFDAVAMDELLGIAKDGFKSRAVVAIGYRSTEDVYSTWKKVRKPIDQLVKHIAKV